MVRRRSFAILLIEPLQLLGTFTCTMIKLPMTKIERIIAERELSRARGMLRDLVEIHGSGHWRHYYKKGKFADEVRRVKHAVDYWVEACNRPSRV